MFFLNLSAGEFFGLLGVLGGTITALYLLDRSKRRKVVSTLQFWVSASGASEQRSRKKVNQPWSLLLQLLSLSLLLLAIAQLQWGTRAAAGRDHVLLVDTSSWSAARSSREATLNVELRIASQYLTSLPAQDRVLLARANALTAPATLFTADREQTRTALRETKSSLSALDLVGALNYAEQAQRGSGGLPGEIVYVGPQRIGQDGAAAALPRNLRVLGVPVTGANCGIRRMDVGRGEVDPSSWHAQITFMNYATLVQQVRLRTQFAGTRFAIRNYAVPPHQEVTAEYNFVTNTGGQLTAEIEGDDILPQDNRATLRLPGNSAYAVTVFTKRAASLKPLLGADRRISATFLDTSSLTSALAGIKPKPELVIFDSVSYNRESPFPSIWINPAQGGSPFSVREVVNKATIKSWNANALMAEGLRAREERIPQATIFNSQADDITLASISGSPGLSASITAEGPAVIVRSRGKTGNKMAAIGFDPLDSHLRFTVTTPLLFANLLEWMAPEAVRATELRAGRVGSASVTLEPDEIAANLRVTAEDGVSLPFTVHEKTLQLFVDKPTVAHVVSASRDRILSLTLPDVAEFRWAPEPANVATGLPSFTGMGGTSFDLWQWLACLGAVGLIAEWLLFGRSGKLRRPPLRTHGILNVREQPEEEMVAQ